MYNNFAEYYDKLFPLTPEQLNFFQKLIDKIKYPKTMLDVGCATGSLVLALEDKLNSAFATDISKDMINIAKSKIYKPSTVFNYFDMLRIADMYFNSSFALISCLGNTIVHLNDIGEVDNFISQARKLLRPGGTFIIQILNYSCINEKLPIFEDIENKKFTFKRECRKAGNKIEFITYFKPTDADETKIFSVHLLPLTFEVIAEILKENGFKKIKSYSNWEKSKFNKKSFQLIIEAS